MALNPLNSRNSEQLALKGLNDLMVSLCTTYKYSLYVCIMMKGKELKSVAHIKV